MDIKDRSLLEFRTAKRKLITTKLDIGALTDRLQLRIRRPTKAEPIGWDDKTTIKVSIVVLVDGVEYRCSTQTTGGVRSDGRGGDAPYSGLILLPTVSLPDDLSNPIIIDGKPFVRMERLGEKKSERKAWIEFEQLSGNDFDTELLIAETSESQAQLTPLHFSVAYNTVTSGSEEFDDGVLTVSHTSAGSDRAAFAGVSAYGEINTATCGLTYAGGGGTLSELWDDVRAAGSGWNGNAAYSKIAPAASAQDVVATLSIAPGELILRIISMTGVHQTTPTGSVPTLVSGTGSPMSITVSGVGANDLVLDNLIQVGDTNTAVGADQTDRGTITLSTFVWGAGSSQLGSSGGVMSWTHSGTSDGWTLGAVAFLPTSSETYEQEGFRWRNDDGSESAATWKAAQDASASIAVSTNVRLRALINRTG